MDNLQEQGGPSFEDDIGRLERNIRMLKVRYDMFLAGAIPREPVELRRDVERVIRRWSNTELGKYHQRFMFNALVARYNCMSDLLGKTLRERESGNRPAAAVADRVDQREKVVASVRLKDPGSDAESLRQLHSRFVQARGKRGAGAAVPFDKFARAITAQADRIRQKSSCERVELRVVVSGGEVLLKARPGR